MFVNAQLAAETRASSRTARAGNGARAPARARYLLYASPVLLLVLIPFQCARLKDPQADYLRVQHLFESGYLARSQEQAALAYARYATAQPAWAARFLLLEAESMEWRGMYEDALRLLSSRSSNFFGAAGLKKLTLESVALTHLEKVPAATVKLAEAERWCAVDPEQACGEVLRARGILALEKGELDAAKAAFHDSLDAARKTGNRILETTVLLYIGVVSTQNEHYDEALDWSRAAHSLAVQSGEQDLAQVASGNLGWAYFKLGDKERALELLSEAQKQATDLGDVLFEIKWLTTIAYVYSDTGRIEPAKQAYLRALDSARAINSKDDVSGILVDLAQVALAARNPNEADSYAHQAEAMAEDSGNRDDQADVLAIRAQTAALRGDAAQAEKLLADVKNSPDSQTSMIWASEHALAKLYERGGDTGAALKAYRSALSTFESARAEIQSEDSRLPFLSNATRIYDDYIHFLVGQGKTDEALAAADQSRARTLAQSLGVVSNKPALQLAAWRPTNVARKAGATILFYWLGQNQSYLWAITPTKTSLFTLPAQGEIARLVERYRKALLGPDLGGGSANDDGIALYDMLVAPAASLIPSNGNVVVVSDGPLSLLNFETLIVPGAASGSGQRPHYWIEEANIVSAPSLSLLASRKVAGGSNGKLLLLGNAVSPDPDYPDLPMAPVEMGRIEKHFTPAQETVFTHQAATSRAYLSSPLEQYAYIHFVAHGVASRTDPLDSAIILSRTGGEENSFKLHARDIMQHPIDARLVTISACYGGGTRSFAGEGLVGLSWAFLHAGAHNVIGALWEASDDSTPQLMDNLYEGLEDGMSPSAALRQAKLALVHSQEKFRQPFYWAPFELYTGM